MLRNTIAVIIISLFLCLTFNYTFPLHRKSYRRYANDTNMWRIHQNHGSIMDRSKKMASNIENVIRKIKDTTQDLGKNIYVHINSKNPVKYILSDEDLRQYEQLVIMKKYPYLDLKEKEMKFSPTNKNARHDNHGFHPEANINDPSICDPNDDSINVEIINRGLSGVAIPSKHPTTLQVSINNNLYENEKINVGEKYSEFTLHRLNNDVNEYLKRKGFETS
ncbi:uncharacterized protein LOC119839373 [Zerene cesonia]|uniref:uncharacterized protein LOC119839373 n=1 Tax=Zerene cesonia TaxID=33412 RepID=UPI0018E52644|nr:uncharacterized protein LOC119839373 [Zerene cesonia]